MKLEVAIVAFHSQDTLPKAIRSLALLGDDVGVAIHDNSPGVPSLREEKEEARAAGLPLREERCPQNCGFARGCNALARGSLADYIMFLNPDAEILRWDPRLLSPKRLVGPLTLNSAGKISVSWGGRRTAVAETLRRLPGVGHATRLALRFGRFLGVKPRWLSGSALLVERSRFLDVGGFDEGFFMYYEDIDFCERWRRAGGHLTLDHRWVVRHAGGVSSFPDDPRVLIRTYESGRHFFRKHYGNARGYEAAVRLDAHVRLILGRVAGRGEEEIRAIEALRDHMQAHHRSTP
jgi:N-acetylglucosaminyl-diphospho-decaprenol L-rhamnosyltransferase